MYPRVNNKKAVSFMPTALLVIDVQQGLCAGPTAVTHAQDVIGRINHLSDAARAADVPVIMVRHEDNTALIHDSPAWQSADGLRVMSSDLSVRKLGSDAFHATGLENLLRTRYISHLVICGMQTDFCVDSTVRRALALGYTVTLVADGHTTADNGILTAQQIIAHHNTTLARLRAYGVRATLLAARDIRF